MQSTRIKDRLGKRQAAIDTRNKIEQAFLELQNEFPFGKDYVEHKRAKYFLIASQLVAKCPGGAALLSIGSGPCDLEAILSKLGFRITAIDDLKDQWHLIGKNRERIIDFAEQMGIHLIVEEFDASQVQDSFDAVLLIDVVEHLHNSPRELLNFSISTLKPNGFLVIVTPNSTALTKRLLLLFGKTPQVNVHFLYWNVGTYRSHVREYSPSELKSVLWNHNLRVVKAQTLNWSIDEWHGRATVKVIKTGYKLVCWLYPNFKDSILVIAEKPTNWQPTEASIKKFREYYPQMDSCNLDGESDEAINRKIIL